MWSPIPHGVNMISIGIVLMSLLLTAVATLTTTWLCLNLSAAIAYLTQPVTNSLRRRMRLYFAIAVLIVVLISFVLAPHWLQLQDITGTIILLWCIYGGILATLMIMWRMSMVGTLKDRPRVIKRGVTLYTLLLLVGAVVAVIYALQRASHN